MSIEHHKLSIQKTAHYYTYGNLTSHTEYFLFICHGYAQRAEEVLGDFNQLDPAKYFVVAPEGLSRFYRKGFYGEVVASWMTKDDRLDEINDYSRYLQTLYEQFVGELEHEVHIVLIGFSQGASTIMRWICARYPYYDVFVNWAGWVPEDIDYESCLDYFKSGKNYFVYGLDDPFLPQDKIQELEDFTKERNLPFRFFHFSGKHELDVLYLQKLISHKFPSKRKSKE